MKKKGKAKPKVNRYEADAGPQATLDFHTFGPITSQEVKDKTERFVAQAIKKGHDRIGIITGKGLHSKGRPVVKPQVKRTLEKLRSEGTIRDFYVGKVTAGGDGVLIVDL